MRLIDADALNIDFYDEYETEDDAYAYGYISKHQIDMAPTIDAVEVVHGKWIEHKERTIVMDNNFVDFFPTESECSNCGLRRATYFIDSPLSNYCPNCGAKMKGADDE